MKHVLVTGGADGLGKATAQKLVEAGFRVTILSRGAEKTKTAADEIGCSYVVADVTDAAQVETAVKQAGEIDILINNAGVWVTGLLEANTPDEIALAVATNVLGVINCTRAVVGQMKQRKSGRIININSVAGQRVKAERSVYTATKWAVTGFTGSMHEELRPYKIAVTDFFPTAMATEFFNKVGDGSDRTGALDPAIAAAEIVHLCQLPDHVDVPDFSIQSLDY